MIERAWACGAKPLPATDCCAKRNVELPFIVYCRIIKMFINDAYSRF